jgi:hypothetical protein
MRTLLAIVAIMLAVAPGEKPERDAYRPPTVSEPAAHWHVVEGEPIESGDMSSVRTDFECMALGVHERLCWLKNGARICARDVEIVDSEIHSFGERSLATDDPAGCLSDDAPPLMLTFEPFPTSIQLSAALDPNSARDRVRIACWSAGSNIGDESSALVLEPPEAMLPGDTYGWGIGVSVGFAACRVYGIVDNIWIYGLE